jgi:transcriptional regulator with XRE-family HTH domain
MNLNFKVIGKRVKEFRKSKKLSQEILAEMCNLSTSYISRIESGKKKASLKSLVKIGNILEIPTNILLNGKQDNEFLEYKSKLMFIIEDCNNYEKKVIFDLVIAMKRSLRNNY